MLGQAQNSVGFTKNLNLIDPFGWKLHPWEVEGPKYDKVRIQNSKEISSETEAFEYLYAQAKSIHYLFMYFF